MSDPLEPVKNVVFDFDGTLCDSLLAVFHELNAQASRFGYPQTAAEEIPRLRKLRAQDVLRQSGVSLLKLPFVAHVVKRELEKTMASLPLFKGVKETLEQLQAQGKNLGILTSNSKRNVAAFLKAHHLEHHFAFVISGSGIFGKARDLRKMLKHHRLHAAQTVYVGDETRDVEAAKKVGIRVCAVSWGFNAQEVLQTLRPDYLAKDVKELPILLER